MRKLLLRILVGASLGLLNVAAPAQPHPATIRFIVPFPAGGAGDQITRLVANETSVILGTPIVVENKAGAGGLIAAETALRAEADGSTFFIGSNGPLVINAALYSKIPYDVEKDFVPVAGLGKTPLLLVTRKNLDVTSVAGLIALGKKTPGGFSMGSAGSGNITHLAGEGASQMGLKVAHVPFRGSAPAITDMLGGHVDIMFDALPSSMQQARAGSIMPLAILATSRFALLPKVPTLAEVGFPGMEASAWFGVVAKTGMSRSVIDQLNKAINQALARPELIEKMHNIGAEPMSGTPEKFGCHITDERARWLPLARSLQLKAE